MNKVRVIRRNTDYNVQKIIETVATHYGLIPSDIHENTRIQNICHARKVCYAVCRELLKNRATLEYLGKKIGNKNHATVLFAANSIKDFCDVDKYFKCEYDIILEKCRAVILVHSKEDKSLADRLTDLLKYEEKINMKIAIRELINEF